MGTVPISNISPLAVSRTEEAVLEPPAPIYRVENSSGQSGGNDDEAYSPSKERSAAEAETTLPEPVLSQDSVDAEAQASSADAAAHQINFFA